MKEWNIGDKVKVVEYDAIPAERRAKLAGGNPELWTSGKCRLSGLVGEVADKLYGEAYGCYVYKLNLEGYERTSNALFIGDDLEALPKKQNFRWEIELLENVVVARMYDGDVQLSIGHGHVFHDGALGIMQAASWSMKKCYEAMGGTFYRPGRTEDR